LCRFLMKISPNQKYLHLSQRPWLYQEFNPSRISPSSSKWSIISMCTLQLQFLAFPRMVMGLLLLQQMWVHWYHQKMLPHIIEERVRSETSVGADRVCSCRRRSRFLPNLQQLQI
jgi:hypothetical protein